MSAVPDPRADLFREGATLALPDDLDMSPFGLPELSPLPPLALFPGVRSHLDRQFAGPPGYRPLLLDLHVPESADDGPVPVAVYGHGGGFLAGSRRAGPWRFLLDAGIAVASFSYRFSGEAPFPAALHDAAAAVRWVRTHADGYGLDGDRVVGFGSSAGAHLVSAVGLLADHDDDGLLGRLGPTPDVSCRLAAVVDHYAPTDWLALDDDAPDDVVEVMDTPGSTMARVLGHVPSARSGDTELARLSRHVHPAAPPFLIVHGDRDRRVGPEQSRRLHRAVVAAGVSAELLLLPGADHGGPAFDQPQLHEATLRFLGAALGKGP